MEIYKTSNPIQFLILFIENHCKVLLQAHFGNNVFETDSYLEVASFEFRLSVKHYMFKNSF